MQKITNEDLFKKVKTLRFECEKVGIFSGNGQSFNPERTNVLFADVYKKDILKKLDKITNFLFKSLSDIGLVDLK